MGVCCSGRMVRTSSLFFRIGQSFSISLLSAVSTVVSCNKLPWLVNFFLLLLVWYSIPPSFSVCFAKGSLLDLLTGSIGFSVFFSFIATLFRCQVGFLGMKLEFVLDVDLFRFSFRFVITFEVVVVVGYDAQV